LRKRLGAQNGLDDSLIQRTRDGRARERNQSELQAVLESPGVFVDSRTQREYPEDDIETKILVYEDRVLGWFLQYGQLLQEHHDAAFVVLQVALAQIEGIEQYRRGMSSERKEGEFFRSGITRVFSLTNADDQWLRDLYRLVRCGLFHDGMTRAGVQIENRFDRALEFDGANIKISPNKFLDAVTAYFTDYMAQLKEPANVELRNSFERKWDTRV
jgi:hypothetical protein